MSRQSRRDRETAIRNMDALGIRPDDQRRFLRLGATLQRLAEAQCNGDYPADNGQRHAVACGMRHYHSRDQGLSVCNLVKVSEGCGSLWVPSSLRKTRGYLCPDCCVTEDARKLAASYGLHAIINGDPRGAILRLATAEEWNAGEQPGADIECGRVTPRYIY